MNIDSLWRFFCMKRGEIIRLFHIGASVHDVVVEAAEGEEVRGRGGRGGGQKKTPTAEELDAELDAYNSKVS